MPNNAPKGPAPKYTEEQLSAMPEAARKKIAAAVAKRARQKARKKKMDSIEWAGKHVKDMEP